MYVEETYLHSLHISVAIRVQFRFGSSLSRGSASRRKKRVKKESDSTFPVPEGKEGRAFIYISFESGRPVITAAALALFLLLLLLRFSIPRKVSLFRLALPSPLRMLLPSASLSSSPLSSLLDATTSINADTSDRYRQSSSCQSISGPHYQSARGRPSSAMDEDEEEEEERAGGVETREVERQHQWPWLLRS